MDFLLFIVLTLWTFLCIVAVIALVIAAAVAMEDRAGEGAGLVLVMVCLTLLISGLIVNKHLYPEKHPTYVECKK